MPVEERLAGVEWRNIEASASADAKVLQKALGANQFGIMSIIAHRKTWQILSILFAANNVANGAFKRILIWFHLEGENESSLYSFLFFRYLATTYCSTSPSTQRNNLKLWAPGCCRIPTSAWNMSLLRIGSFWSASLKRSRRSITFLVDGSGWQWERETITLEMWFAPSTSAVAFRILVHGTSDKRSAKHRFTMRIQLCRKLLT